VIDFEFTDEDKEHIDSIEEIINRVPEDEFVANGYHFTYKSVALLVDRVRQLEVELELQKMIMENYGSDYPREDK
jgi:beta-lactamase superfamily II metal-dependent hydrolase